MFEIFTKEIEIDGKHYNIRPLSGRFMPKFFKVVKALEKASQHEDDFIQHLDEEAMGAAHEIALETFKASYPKEDVDKLDMFVSRHLMQLLPAVTQVNMPETAEDTKEK